MKTETPPPTRVTLTVPTSLRPKPTVSVVIPVYNERGTLEQLHREVCEELERQGGAFEIIFIDDGSTDGSSDLLASLAQKDPRVQVHRFRGNQGKAEALNYGFALASG